MNRSAQEPRLTSFISQDPAMIQAYVDGKDLYAIIAQSAFDNNYEDNLEFYAPGTTIQIDGKNIVTGDGNTPYELTVNQNQPISLKSFNILEIKGKGDTQVAYLKPGDIVISDIGDLIIDKIDTKDEDIFIYFKN